MRKKTVQKRLENYGISGIKGGIDERNAQVILLEKKPFPIADARTPFRDKLRKLDAQIKATERIKAHRKEDIEKHERKRFRRQTVWNTKINEEVRKIFSAKPYDPHKTERSRVVYKNIKKSYRKLK